MLDKMLDKLETVCIILLVVLALSLVDACLEKNTKTYVASPNRPTDAYTLLVYKAAKDAFRDAGAR